MGGDAACEAAVTLRRRGEVVEGNQCDGGWVAAAGTETMSSVSSTTSSLFSSTTSSLTDEEEDAVSSSSSSLTSSGSGTTTQMGEAASGQPGPLYALSTMMEDLPPLRTGLSKHYKGRSQSFTSLSDVSCVEDLAKKIIPYTRRKKAPGRCAEVLGAKNQLSKTISKKAPRGKPPAYQGKIDVQMLGHGKKCTVMPNEMR